MERFFTLITFSSVAQFKNSRTISSLVSSSILLLFSSKLLICALFLLLRFSLEDFFAFNLFLDIFLLVFLFNTCLQNSPNCSSTTKFFVPSFFVFSKFFTFLFFFIDTIFLHFLLVWSNLFIRESFSSQLKMSSIVSIISLRFSTTLFSSHSNFFNFITSCIFSISLTFSITSFSMLTFGISKPLGIRSFTLQIFRNFIWDEIKTSFLPILYNLLNICFSSSVNPLCSGARMKDPCRSVRSCRSCVCTRWSPCS